MEFGLLILLMFVMALIPALLVMGILVMLVYIWRRGAIQVAVCEFTNNRSQKCDRVHNIACPTCLTSIYFAYDHYCYIESQKGLALKKLFIGLALGLLLVLIGFGIFNIHQTSGANQWNDFLKTFGLLLLAPFGGCVVLLVAIINAYRKEH